MENKYKKSKFNWFVRNENSVIKILFSLLISTFLTAFLVGRLRKILPYIISKAKEIESVELKVTDLEYILLIIGFLLILLIPVILMFLDKEKKYLKIISFVAICVNAFVVFVNLWNVLEISEYLVLSLFLLVWSIIYIIIELLINTYKWLWISKDDKDSKQIDVAKLTFIWAIIIFIYGVFFK